MIVCSAWLALLVVALLLDDGARAQQTQTNDDGLTPLFIALIEAEARKAGVSLDEPPVSACALLASSAATLLFARVVLALFCFCPTPFRCCCSHHLAFFVYFFVTFIDILFFPFFSLIIFCCVFYIFLLFFFLKKK